MKRYSIKDADGKENKAAKGINQNVAKNTEHQEYIDVSFNKKWWDLTWKKFKVNCKVLELMMFVKFIFLVIMIKDVYYMN